MPDEGPNATDGTWVSLVPYLAAGRTARGRNYELDTFEAGTMTLTLKSDTRLFDPDNTAGTYYGKLLPMRQVRVLAQWAGMWYPVFRGYIQTWGNTTPSDKLFVTTVVAKDAFALLEQRKLPSSAWALEIVKDNPSAWFRLGESDTVRVTDSSPNGNYGVYDNCQQGAQGLVVNDADGAAQFAHSLEERVVIQNPNLITGYPFAVSAMVKIDGTQPAGGKYLFTALMAPPSASTNFLHVLVDTGVLTSTPGLLVLSLHDGTNYAYVWSSIRIDDGLPHHVVVVAGSSNRTSWSIYVDGVDVTIRGGGTNPSWPGQPPNGYVVGNFTDLLQGDYGFGTNNSDGSVHDRGTIDEVCVWNGTAPAADRIAAHALAALTGWADDDTGTRVSRFLDRIGWPSDLRDIDTGASVLGPASWSAGTSALSVLQSWAQTELGAFFIGRSGEIVWRSRHYPLLNLAATRSTATFGDGHAGETLMYDNDLELDRDETLIRNPVLASRTNGVTVSVRDDNLADTVYGDRTWASPATEDKDDASVRDRAMWLLGRYKNLSTRVKQLRISPRRDPNNLWPQVLGREIGDRITVQRTPLGTGDTNTYEQIIERVEHEFSVSYWRTSWTCSPTDPNVGSYLILDDATQGLLDSALLAY